MIVHLHGLVPVLYFPSALLAYYSGFLREIITIFLEDTPQRMDEMQAALAASDAPAYSRAAHSIKGSAANLGADMIVAGAYHHSQLRESLLGGVSRDLLDHMTVPVLMSH